MANYIKSHSNYVLKSKHQDVSDGTIFERDITTIGAVDQFSPGQTPIYRSNNFIITVRNDGRPSNQYNSTKWKENDYGETWTLQTVNEMVSDFEDDNDTKIVLKQDYYDFRDFAYYGSLTELFRASVTDILARFPGELYITNNHAYYTVVENYNFDRIETQKPLGGYKEGSETEPKPKYYLISNPFSINLHAKHIPDGANPLRYFAEEGYLNYQIGFGTEKTEGCDIIEDIKWCDIKDVEVTFHDPCSKKPDVPFCDCDTMIIEQFDPSKPDCGCKDIKATLSKPDCGCNDIKATLVEDRGAQTNTRGFRVSLRASDDDSEEETEDSEEFYRRVVRIDITYQCGEDQNVLTIYGYLDDGNNIVYMVDDESLIGVHIRPRKGEEDKSHYFLDEFYSNSDNFQKLLVNEDTHYKATFSVIRENDYGYYREFVPFQFPTGEGGYNLDATDYGFNAYTSKMVEIGEYYDENFTDNLWRSMTHESIKNFDWTYTREFETGEEEEYVFGGQRIQKALRIFAREFDEIISYINNIKNINRVTYDERNNIPDYFLTDTLENEGWDIKLVYPYSLTEYYYDENNNRVICDDNGTTQWIEGGDSCDGQLNNMACGHHIIRDFSQNSTNKVKPYTKDMLDSSIRDGYFMVCKNCTNSENEEATSNEEEKGIPHCGYDDDKNYIFVSTNCKTLYDDDCALSNKGVLKNRIRNYTDETEWSYQQVNNEFLRRLKLNSRYIWRHKGTQEGIEMILGMFGMKSKRWIEAQPQWVRDCKYTECNNPPEGEEQNCELTWDYDMQEYTSFTSRIEETWDVVHQNYRINWINSTKAITYDNRFVSNYNKYGANSYAIPYQGIPVSYREAYVSQEGDDAYLSYGEGEGRQYYLNETNNKVIKRYLYPNFNKDEQLDGNPYFQMKGGWLAKTIVGETTEEGEDETPIWNFQYDANDNIVFNKYLKKGFMDENSFINDNKPLFKETVRNIRRTDSIGSLLSIPTNNLYNGIICYVTKIEKNSAVIDNAIYPITSEWYVSSQSSSENNENNGRVVSYVTLTKTSGFIRVGNNKFFDTNIIVYDVDGSEFNYNVEEMKDGDQIKAYIINGGFICKEDESGYYSIANFQILDDQDESIFSNYFKLDDVNYADSLAEFIEDENTNRWTSGWRRLTYDDKDYLKINTISNYYEGNNPHNGNMIYDNGHDYFTYYERLFKHASDNDLFDERCYEDYFDSLDNEIVYYGFNGLIEENEDILQYDDFLVPDTKIHYFGNYKVKKGEEKSNGIPNIDKVYIYGDDTYRLSGETEGQGGFDVIYLPETTTVKDYNLSATTENGWIEKENPYNTLIPIEDTVKEWDEQTQEYVEKKVKRYPVMDEVTNQIVNNKIFDITFRLHNKWYSKEGQEELKYIDDVVMNYLTQMIPSTTILRVKYELFAVTNSNSTIEEVTDDSNNG